MDQLAATRVKVRKLVTSKKLVQRFEYHCPFCKQVNGRNCAYMGESLEWKIQHSLKKPWTETIIERKVVEEPTGRVVQWH